MHHQTPTSPYVDPALITYLRERREWQDRAALAAPVPRARSGLTREAELDALIEELVAAGPLSIKGAWDQTFAKAPNAGTMGNWLKSG